MAITGKDRVIELLNILIIKDKYAFDTTGAELNKEVDEANLKYKKAEEVAEKEELEANIEESKVELLKSNKEGLFAKIKKSLYEYNFKDAYQPELLTKIRAELKKKVAGQPTEAWFTDNFIAIGENLKRYEQKKEEFETANDEYQPVKKKYDESNIKKEEELKAYYEKKTELDKINAIFLSSYRIIENDIYLLNANNPITTLKYYNLLKQDQIHKLQLNKIPFNKDSFLKEVKTMQIHTDKYNINKYDYSNITRTFYAYFYDKLKEHRYDERNELCWFLVNYFIIALNNICLIVELLQTQSHTIFNLNIINQSDYFSLLLYLILIKINNDNKGGAKTFFELLIQKEINYLNQSNKTKKIIDDLFKQKQLKEPTFASQESNKIFASLRNIDFYTIFTFLNNKDTPTIDPKTTFRNISIKSEININDEYQIIKDNFNKSKDQYKTHKITTNHNDYKLLTKNIELIPAYREQLEHSSENIKKKQNIDTFTSITDITDITNNIDIPPGKVKIFYKSEINIEPKISNLIRYNKNSINTIKTLYDNKTIYFTNGKDTCSIKSNIDNSTLTYNQTNTLYKTHVENLINEVNNFIYIPIQKIVFPVLYILYEKFNGPFNNETYKPESSNIYNVFREISDINTLLTTDITQTHTTKGGSRKNHKQKGGDINWETDLELLYTNNYIINKYNYILSKHIDIVGCNIGYFAYSKTEDIYHIFKSSVDDSLTIKIENTKFDSSSNTLMFLFMNHIIETNIYIALIFLNKKTDIKHQKLFYCLIEYENDISPDYYTVINYKEIVATIKNMFLISPKGYPLISLCDTRTLINCSPYVPPFYDKTTESTPSIFNNWRSYLLNNSYQDKFSTIIKTYFYKNEQKNNITQFLQSLIEPLGSDHLNKFIDFTTDQKKNIPAIKPSITYFTPNFIFKSTTNIIKQKYKPYYENTGEDLNIFFTAINEEDYFITNTKILDLNKIIEIDSNPIKKRMIQVFPLLIHKSIFHKDNNNIDIKKLL